MCCHAIPSLCNFLYHCSNSYFMPFNLVHVNLSHIQLQWPNIMQPLLLNFQQSWYLCLAVICVMLTCVHLVGICSTLSFFVNDKKKVYMGGGWLSSQQQQQPERPFSISSSMKVKANQHILTGFCRKIHLYFLH